MNAQALSQDDIVLPPSDGLWLALGKFVCPMMDRVIANAQESRALSQTRDLLLPKLMSGEIRLRETEAAVKAVAR